MRTLILPGYSRHNKEWAEKIALRLEVGHELIVHSWKHWSGGRFSLKKEVEEILREVSRDGVNIIAKSVGVYVAFNLIPKISSQVNKVIFCGIASTEGENRKKLAKEVFSKIPVENVLCIQNENDRFVPYSEAEKFYHSINPRIKVISMPRSDHEYPYPEEFRKFLVR